MSESGLVGPLPEEGCERHSDSVPNHFEDVVEEFGDVYFPLRLFDEDHYARGSLDLYVCCSIGDRDWCVILNHSLRPIITENTYQSVIHPSNDRSLDPGANDWELHMFVVIGETLEPAEEMDCLVPVISHIVGLLSLDEFTRLRAHFASAGSPLSPIFRSLLVLPGNVVLPHPSPENGEHDMGAHFRWVEKNCQVIERGVNVMDEVTRDQSNVRVDGFGGMESIVVTLALSPIGQRVGVGVRILGDCEFQITEVLFGPVELLKVRGIEDAHAES